MNMFIRFPNQALFKTIVPLVLLVFLLPCTLLLANNPPTGAVTITGTAQVGQTLTVANTLADADGLGVISYQWFRDGQPIVLGDTLKDGVGGVDGLDDASGVTLSADGNHAYVAGREDDAVSWYSRNASTGALTYGGVLKDGVNGVDGLDGARDVTLSADGNHAYVTGYNDSAVSWYERNASTGALTYGGVLKDGVGGVDGLFGASGMTLSADGNHAYVTGTYDDAISWYSRNASTGALTYGGVLKDGVGGVDGLDYAYGVTLSADGNHAYVTGYNDVAVGWYERNASTGALTYGGVLKDGVGGVDGLNGAYGITLSADGNHAYVTGTADAAVSWYERNASTGALTYGGMLKDGVGGVDGLTGARNVTLSADGNHAYVTGAADSAVSWYERNASTGALTYGGVLKDGVGGVDGLDAAQGLTLSADGNHAYVTGYSDDAISWYSRNPITGALSYGPASDANYTLTADDVGKAITVTASYTDGGTTAESVASAVTNVRFKPATKTELQTAVNLWVSDNATALSTYGLINTWNVSLITDMEELFKDKTTFNDDLSTWDVSNVTSMFNMLREASSFNQDLSSWDVSNVTNMSNMFYGAESFNGDISSWNVSSVTEMEYMFTRATNFNGDISSWDVSSVIDLSSIFRSATSFNQTLLSWDMSSVTDMHDMFQDATSFNGDISGWDVSSATNMEGVFWNASSFNQDISDWNVSNVTNMGDMFTSANALSNGNKGLTHTSFSPNSNWPYDWSAFVNDIPVLNQGSPSINLTATAGAGPISWSTWDKRFGGGGFDMCSDLVTTADGGYLLVGQGNVGNNGDVSQNSRGGFDYWAVRVDANGAKVWDKRFGGGTGGWTGAGPDYCRAVIATADGGFLLAGKSGHVSGATGQRSESSRGDYDYWAVKLDANGNKVWDKSLGGSGLDICHDVVATPDGGYLFVGESNSTAGGDKSQGSQGMKDFWAVKVNANGTKVWDKRFGGAGDDSCNAVIATVDGGYLLVGDTGANSGATGDRSEPSRGWSDYWVVKIDANGVKQWDKTFGGTDGDYCADVVATPDGGFLLAGKSKSGANGDKSQQGRGASAWGSHTADFWAIKINSIGTKIWDKRFGGSEADKCTAAIVTSDGGYLLVGDTKSGVSGDKSEPNRGNQDYWVLKIDDNGNKVWDKSLGGGAGDFATSVVQDVSGGYLVAGRSGNASGANGDRSQSSRGNEDFWAVKLDGNGNRTLHAVDTDGDNLTWSLLTPANHGTATVSGTGVSPTTFSYSPNPGFQGTDSFVVRVSDGDMNDSITVNVTVTDANDAPTGTVSITGTAQAGQVLTVANTLADADGLGTITYQWKRDGVPIVLGGTLKDGVNGIDGLDKVNGITLSADGSHAYVTGLDDDSVSWYERNANTGALTYGGMLKDGVGGVDGLNGAKAVTLSPDGLHAYVAARFDHAVSWFTRNASTGALTYGGMLKDGVGGVDGLNVARDITLSADGNHAYVTGIEDDSVSWFARNASTGALTYGGSLKDGVNGVDGLDAAGNLTLSPDGLHAYVTARADHAVSWFARNTSTGALTYEGVLKDNVNGVAGLNWVIAVKISDDGAHAYASTDIGDEVSWFTRNANTGALTYVGTLKDGVGGVEGLKGAKGVTLSPNGLHAYLPAADDDALSWFSRNPVSGALSYLGMLKNGVGGVEGLDGAHVVKLSPDGLYAYVTGALDDAVSWFTRDPITGALSYGSATGATYTLTQADVGKAITVTASYTDGESTNESVASAATVTVVNANSPPTGTVSITGTAQVGQVLTVANTLADADGLGTIIYQWKRIGNYSDVIYDESAKTITQSIDSWPTGVVVDEANPITLRLTAGSAGASYWDIDVRDDDNNRLTPVSVNDGRNLNGAYRDHQAKPLSEVFAHLFSGEIGDGNWYGTQFKYLNTGAGSVLNASFKEKIKQVTITYRQIGTSWAIDRMKAVTVELVDFTLQSIGTATTDNTHTLVQNDVGKKITVTASYTDGGSTTESVTSAATPEVVIPPTLYPPLPKALAAQDIGNSKYTFWGIIVADGGSPVTGVAFEVADNMVFRNATLHTASMLAGSTNFSATVTLEPGKRYYYRAVASNLAGSTFGSTKKFTTPPNQTQWWSDSVETAGGWRTSPWFGTFRPYDNGWIYHAKLGWAYAHPDGSGGLWLWLEDHHWMWTQQGVFPYLWKHDLGTWHYLIGLRYGQPYFFEWNESVASASAGGCCDGLPNSVDTGSDITHKGVKVSGFEPGGKLCFPNLVAQGASGTTYVYNFKTASGTRGTVTTYQKFSDPRLVYTDPDGQCWETNVDAPGYFKTLRPFEKKDANQAGAGGCCDGLPNTVDTGASTTLKEVTVRGFDEGGKLCFPNLVGQGKSGITYSYNFRTESGARGTVTTYQRFSEPRLVYTDPDGKCWEANLDAPGYFKVLLPLP